MLISITALLLLVISVAIYINRSSQTQTPNGVREGFDRQQKDDVIIIGGGVLGSALAASLGKRGINVTIIERDLNEPNRIVGELLQPGGVEHLKTLGLEDCLEGIDAPTILGYAVVNGNEGVTMDYPSNTKNGEKYFGRSFHHGKFVQNLRGAASKQEKVRVIQGTVTEMIEKENKVVGLKYKENDEIKELYSNCTIICDGIFSKFRNEYLKTKSQANSAFVGFVLSDVKLPYPNRGHVFLCDNTPTLCYPISSNEVRVLIDIPNPVPPNNGTLAQYLRDHVAPQLPAELREAITKELEVCKIRSMPCSRLHPESYTKEGIIFLGDAWNIRHPITGGGMSVGLSDVALLSDLFEKFYTNTQDSTNQIRKQFMTQRVRRVATTNVLAESIYRVMAGRGPMKPMQQAIFSYFKLGPIATNTPVALLACLKTNPWLLISHFFIVAAYGSVQVSLQSLLSIFAAINVIYTAAKFFIPLLYHEHILSTFVFSK